jgi:hypothetical protein
VLPETANGRPPSPGDREFPDFIDGRFHDGHLVKSERLERLEVHALFAKAAQSPMGEPFALPLAEFIAAESDAPPALVGTDEDCLMPAHGLVILGGKSGKGKTTLVIDLAFHLASGREWLRFPVARPLNVLLIENEGPREPFPPQARAQGPDVAARAHRGHLRPRCPLGPHDLQGRPRERSPPRLHRRARDRPHHR